MTKGVQTKCHDGVGLMPCSPKCKGCEDERKQIEGKLVPPSNRQKEWRRTTWEKNRAD